MDTLKKYWLALSVAYFSLLLQFYEIFKASNRYAMRWRTIYLWEVVTAIMLLGTLYYLSYFSLTFLCRRYRAVQRLLNVAALVAMWFVFSRCLISMAVVSSGVPAVILSVVTFLPAKFLIYGASIPMAFAFTKFLKRTMCALYLILSPALLVLMICGLSYWQWEDADWQKYYSLISETESKVRDNDTYILVFDEWSYARTFTPEGSPKLALPNIEKLIAHSTFYPKAYSGGDDTISAIPRFIFQQNGELLKLTELQLSELLFAGKCIPGNSIFLSAPKDSLRIACGIYHNYSGLLSSETDYAARIDDPHVPFWHSVLGMLSTQLSWARIFGIRVKNNTREDLLQKSWASRVQKLHDLLLYGIEHSQVPLFMLFHYAVPHQPFVWSARGRIENPEWDPREHTIKGYLSNIQGVDHFLGEIISALEVAGRYDGATIIVTSDHSWRFDPDIMHTELSDDPFAATERRHVPLIVKNPGQNHMSIHTNITYLLNMF